METTMANRNPAKTEPANPDPIALLTEDHRRVEKMFKQFEKLDSDVEKQELADLICAELTVHAQIEEEIFYPFARDCLDEEDLLDEAEVEHTCAKELIAKIQSGESELFEAQVIVLGEYIKHHVEEEEKELFPKLKKFQEELAVPGVAMLQRKQELMQQMGLAEGAEEEDEEASAETLAASGQPGSKGSQAKPGSRAAEGRASMSEANGSAERGTKSSGRTKQ
jgi:hemerythrin superfamily protein